MIGRVLANRYEILERVGMGGMAYVFRALDRNTQKIVAVKILREELTGDAEFVQRFEREALAASRMTHPNVVSLLDVGIEDELRYIVIEYVSGKSLKDMVREGGGLRSETAGQIAIRILSALQHAHQNGIIHRDIKPQNILLDKEGVIKVLDFGIARLVSLQAEEQPESAIGSVHYFSPEQARGETADEKSDLYSVGVVLYEMLSGTIPFKGETPVEVAMQHLHDKPVPPPTLNPNASVALSEVALRAMAKEPEDRYADAAEMIRAIRYALRYPNIKSKEPDRRKKAERDAEQMERVVRRVKWMRRILAGTFTTLLLVVVGLLIYGMATNLLHTVMDRVTMPNVTNMASKAAAELLKEKGLEVEMREQAVEVGTEGLIIEQDPESGVTLRKGDTVMLTVSVSEYDLIMPDLTRMSLAMAQQLITESKLVLGSHELVASEAREAQVVGQSPEKGVKVRYGQAVSLQVSGGLVVAPNFIGLTEQSATQSIPAAMLLREIIWEIVQDSASDRVVLSQDPPAYERVTLNSPLTLTIGRLDDRVFLAQWSMRVELDEAVQVRVFLKETDGSLSLQYSAMHPSGVSEAAFVVRGAEGGERVCSVYHDDELKEEFAIVLGKGTAQ